MKPIAFYLPQYHPIAENDEWWGKGFTEWTNVRKGLPNFEGHYQPHEPGELGYYDLREVKTLRKQAALAHEYGIHGFCFYYYWFNGRRVLERPLELFASTKDIPLEFCVCWANENWTRTWDGQAKNILLGQNHTPDDDVAFFKSLLPLFADPRYIRVGGAPMVLVYRVDLFPDAKATAARWRKVAREAGFKDVHLCAVQFYGITDPRPWGFDAAVEFPPHQLIGPENKPDPIPKFTNPKFSGGVVDYQKVMSQAMHRPMVDYARYRGVMPSWDNTARRQDTPHMFVNSSPMNYAQWLRRMVDQTRLIHPEDRQFIFINAWNEWGEGCHLEPDARYGRQWLEATYGALGSSPALSAVLDRVRPEELTDEWRAVLEAFEASQRSVVALQEVIRRKTLLLAEQEVRLQGVGRQGVANGLKAVAKKELSRFPRVKGAIKLLRDRVRR